MPGSHENEDGDEVPDWTARAKGKSFEPIKETIADQTSFGVSFSEYRIFKTRSLETKPR